MNLTQAFIRLKLQGFVPNRDLLLVFSGDEETTQATTNMLVSEYRDLIDAEFALNSDSGGGSLSGTGAPWHIISRRQKRPMPRLKLPPPIQVVILQSQDRIMPSTNWQTLY